MYLLCNVSYIDFWDYTPVESYSMIGVGYENLKYETIKHAEILMWIANAPHTQRKDKKLWTIDDFLPEFAKGTKKSQMTVEEIEAAWWNESV